MLLRRIWKAPKSTGKLVFRHRYTAPNDPNPCDFSQVEKITILDANSLAGRHLAFLLKRAEIIKELHLHDDCNARGVAVDLKHMNTKVKVKPHSGDYAIKDALKHSDIVVIPTGLESISDSSEEDLLKQNAAAVYRYGTKIASACPDALVCIMTPPINLMVPMFSEVMKMNQAYDPNKIFGVCSLVEMRANSIVADYLNLDPAAVKVPIVGGVTPSTSVPLFSHATPYNEFSDPEIKLLMNNILEAPEECKRLHSTAPLSSAYALCRFVLTLAAGLCKCKCATQTAFVRSDVLPQVPYFASTIQTSTKGAVANYGLPKIHDRELEMLGYALIALERDIDKARDLFKQMDFCARPDDFIEKPKKPFISKMPVPPCPPCIPADVCNVSVSRVSAPPCCEPAKPETHSIPVVRRRICPD